jgi:hypothetical protein
VVKALARVAVVAAGVAAGVAACQGTSRDAPPATPRRDAGHAAVLSKDPDQNVPDPPTREAPPVKPEEPEPLDDKATDKAEVELGAIAAWQAVVDRTLYLERRGQHGVIAGRLGEAIFDKPGAAATTGGDAGVADAGVADAGVADAGPRGDGGPPFDAGPTPTPYRWLIDDSDGNGALAVRVALGTAKAKAGDRIAVRGAWALDDQRRWFWRAEQVSPLPAAPASKLKEAPVAPGHEVSAGPLPPGARTISLAKDNDVVYFQVVGPPPAVDGDGWKVADELGNPPVALLNLPGERATYGGQDMRAADERWTLRRGVTYWVRIGAIHRHGADKPATINARTAPIRVL